MKSLKLFVTESLLINEDVTVKNKETGNIYDVKKLNPKTQVKPTADELQKADKATSDDSATTKADKADDTKVNKGFDAFDKFNDFDLDDIDGFSDIKPVFKKKLNAQAEEYRSGNKKRQAEYKSEDIDRENARSEKANDLDFARTQEDKKLKEKRTNADLDAKHEMNAGEYAAWKKDQVQVYANQDQHIKNERTKEDMKLEKDYDDEDDKIYTARKKSEEKHSFKFMTSIQDFFTKNAKELPGKLKDAAGSFLGGIFNNDHIGKES